MSELAQLWSRRETLGSAKDGIRCTIKPDASGVYTNYHFDLAGCDDCLVRHLASRSLEWVEGRYNGGYVPQATWEAYAYVWATSAPRFGSYDHWTTPPTDPEVSALVDLFREALAAKRKKEQR